MRRIYFVFQAYNLSRNLRRPLQSRPPRRRHATHFGAGRRQDPDYDHGTPSSSVTTESVEEGSGDDDGGGAGGSGEENGSFYDYAPGGSGDEGEKNVFLTFSKH